MEGAEFHRIGVLKKRPGFFCTSIEGSLSGVFSSRILWGKPENFVQFSHAKNYLGLSTWDFI